MDAGKHVAYIVATPSGDEFARKIAGHLKSKYFPRRGIEGVDPWVPTQYTVFADTHGFTRIDESIRGRTVYVVADVLNPRIALPQDADSLEGYVLSMKSDGYEVLKNNGPVPTLTQKMHVGWNVDVLCSTLDAVKNAVDNGRVIVVAPYFPNSRQDKRDGRDSLDLKATVDKLAAMGADGVMCIDIHNPSSHLAFPRNMPLHPLRSPPTFITYLSQHYDRDNLYVMNPDESSIKRNMIYPKTFDCPVGSIYKRRNQNAPNELEREFGFMGRPEEVEGKRVFIFDDILDTLNTGSRAVEYTKEELGAAEIYLVGTFGVFSGKAIKRAEKLVHDSVINKVIVTNAVTQARQYSWLDIVDVSKYFAKVIDAHCNGESISKLLDED